MRDEIIAGLRNALERGQSLEQAAKSFVNAGYNPQEVRAAVNELSGGVSDIVYSNQDVPENKAQEAPKPVPRVQTIPVTEDYSQQTRPLPSQQNNLAPQMMRNVVPTVAPAPRPVMAPSAPSNTTNSNLNSLPPLPKLPGTPIERIDTGIRSKWILVLIIICSAIFLAGVGYLAYYLMTK